MSVMEQDSAGAPARASLLNDPKARGIFYQLLLVVALLPAQMQGAVLSAIPTATLGALLLIAAWDLAVSRRLIDARPSCHPVIATTALATVLLNPLLGLFAGTLAELIRKAFISRFTTWRG